MAEAKVGNVYGTPPEDLVGAYDAARQFSPLLPGSEDLEECAEASLDGLVMLALPGSVERRHAIASALRALRPDARLVVVAPKDKGGSRIAGDLRALGCVFDETARRHHRICVTRGPGDASAIAAALALGKPRYLEEIDLWSQPGVFSWNRVDAGSALLLTHLPPLSGTGADFGCGIGALSRAVLLSPKVVHLAMIDIDRRAIDMAKRNVDDARTEMLWADARATNLTGLDFVVMNPPFHEGGSESHVLGQSFIRRAATALRAGGSLWLAANRHLPYEAILKPLFLRVNVLAESGGYKILQAQK